MESRTFHPFPRLPKELRDTIWALAIRPDRPSAQFFTVFDSSNDSEWALLSQHSMRYRWEKRCSLAAPRSNISAHGEQQQFSWTRGNRSSYMIDRGLWTACMESRDAMERRFKTAEWNAKREDLFLLYLQHRLQDAPDAPATASFTSGGEWQCFLTHPKSDLFHLQPLNPETIWWHSLVAPIFSASEAFYVSHVAIDYDPGWLGDKDYLDFMYSWASEGTIGCAIRAATDELDWVENLWFVDYRIRRCLCALPPTTSRYEFHGNGCKFTEVRKGDVGWELDHASSVFRFLTELSEKVDEYFVDMRRPWEWDAPPSVLDGRPNVGVLAYEVCCP